MLAERKGHWGPWWEGGGVGITHRGLRQRSLPHDPVYVSATYSMQMSHACEESGMMCVFTALGDSEITGGDWVPRNDSHISEEEEAGLSNCCFSFDSQAFGCLVHQKPQKGEWGLLEIPLSLLSVSARQNVAQGCPDPVGLIHLPGT